MHWLSTRHSYQVELLEPFFYEVADLPCYLNRHVTANSEALIRG